MILDEIPRITLPLIFPFEFFLPGNLFGFPQNNETE